jgi:small neutral amino acid transporter SnatA (MarC family)|nr:MAG TPA: INOVIRUS (FILAMENTOUS BACTERIOPHAGE) STRAIN XF, Helical virus [Inoviridae sp.]
MNSLNLDAFSDAVDSVTGAIGTTVLPAMVGIAVAALGVTLAVSWIKRIRSAV